MISSQTTNKEATNCGVYEIRNKVNGKKYVGSSCQLRVRFNGHKRLLKMSKHHSKALQHAWTRYGPDSFEFRIIAFVEKERLFEVEQALLDRASKDKKESYNMAFDAKAPSRGRVATTERKEQVSRQMKGNKYRQGLSPSNKGNRRQTCVRGHSVSGDNARLVAKRGTYKCRECERISQNERRAKNRKLGVKR